MQTSDRRSLTRYALGGDRGQPSDTLAVYGEEADQLAVGQIHTLQDFHDKRGGCPLRTVMIADIERTPFGAVAGFLPVLGRIVEGGLVAPLQD